MEGLYGNPSPLQLLQKKPENQYSVNISAKKRYIDPLVLVQNNAKRLTDIDTGIRDQIQTFFEY